MGTLGGTYSARVFRPVMLAIITAFDLICKLMWQMSLFCGKPSYVDKKKMDVKTEVSTEELHEITDNAVPVTTKRPRISG